MVIGYSADFGKTSTDYAMHRAGFPIRFFEILKNRHDLGLSGQRVLDIGTGTGTLARGFAGAGCDVSALDPAAAMLEEGRRLAADEGVSVDFRQGRAEELEFPDSSFDLVSAGQCWHWFDAPRVLAEIRRVLKPDGRLVIAHFDWLPLSGNVVAATENLITQYSPDWPMGGGTGFYPQWSVQLGEAGYRDQQSFSFDVDQPYSHEAWRGRIRASAGVGGTLEPEVVAAFDRQLAALLTQKFPQDPLIIPHRCWALIARPPLDNAAMQH